MGDRTEVNILKSMNSVHQWNWKLFVLHYTFFDLMRAITNHHKRAQVI